MSFQKGNNIYLPCRFTCDRFIYKIIDMRFLIVITTSLCLFLPRINAQEETVAKSLWGVQIGIHPFAINNELKITNSIALRNELGFGLVWADNGYYNSTAQWAIVPSVNVEPRYYYNLKKRVKKGKRIDRNSGNYLSLYVGFEPGIGITSNNVDLFPVVSTIPMWGIKRAIGKNFNFETALGVGYGWTFEKHTLYNGSIIRNTERGVTYGIRLALGYNF